MKKTFCTRVSAADTFNLQQVSDGDMVSMGVSKLEQIDLTFIDAGVKINGICNARDLCRILYLPANNAMLLLLITETINLPE